MTTQHLHSLEKSVRTMKTRPFFLYITTIICVHAKLPYPNVNFDFTHKLKLRFFFIQVRVCMFLSKLIIQFSKFTIQVESAGSQLSTVAIKLNEVETIISEGGEDVDDVSVIKLMECMSDVQNEYQTLRKDLKEVQQLQKEMTTSLIFQRQAMLQTFRMLKKRIELRLAEEKN